MSKLRICIAFVAICSILSGCSTVLTTQSASGTNKIYSGVRFDGNIIAGNAYGPAPGFGLFRAFAVVDFPFSFVADTVLLPFTLISAAFEQDQTAGTKTPAK